MGYQIHDHLINEHRRMSIDLDVVANAYRNYDYQRMDPISRGRSEIASQVNKLLNENLIEFSKSNFNSPLILVPKKSTDGTPKYRMCVDYRKLNRKLIPDRFPLPRIGDIFDNLGRSKFFSVMDLQAGFHQIPLSKDSRKNTACSTDNGMYQCHWSSGKFFHLDCQ